MAYIIYKSDDTVLASIATGEVDNVSTSLTLIGKNVNNYGQYINNNLVKLLTSFANVNAPASPQVGQLWFNATSKRLTVYDGTAFNPTYGSTVSGTQPITTSTGDLWYDTINSQLKIWNGNTYKLVGPAVSGLVGKTGVEPPAGVIRDNDTDLPVPVSLLYSCGSPTALITTSSFLMSEADSTKYLGIVSTTDIVKGITFFDNIDVNGNLHIKGDYYVNDVKQFPNGQTLTASFDITAYGNPDPAASDVATAKLNIEAGNIAIKNFLPLMFSTVTNVTYGDLAYPINSVAKVVCMYSNDATLTVDQSVRRFKLIDDPMNPGISIWNWDNVYDTTSLSAMTNIVQI